jgi:pimeloyl-ACP methyl ester carboxylesterase
MSTYVLIHGAWHGGWCWEHVRRRLEAEGHRAIAPDLPGHGDDKTPTASVTLDAYAERVCETIDAQPEPVILVGHSMGGVVITAAAERCPAKIRALVYLCAFIPGNGDTLLGIAGLDDSSVLNTHLVVAEEVGYATVRDEGIVPSFYARCSEADVALAKSRLVPQALAPLAVPLTVTPGRAGRLPRYYVECTEDGAIPIALQRRLVEMHPCKRVFTLETDHSPFFSAVDDLVGCLVQVI